MLPTEMWGLESAMASSLPLPLAPPPAKRRRFQQQQQHHDAAQGFEAAALRAMAARLALHFQRVVNPLFVKGVCDTILGAGWSTAFAKRAACEEMLAEVASFIAACGAHLPQFSSEELRSDLWPLYLTLGPLRSYGCLQALSTNEVRFYLVPLHKQLPPKEFLERAASPREVREELGELAALVKDFSFDARCTAASATPLQFMSSMAVDDKERADLCLFYIGVKHGEEVRRYFGVKAVEREILRRLFATLTERDVRALASGRAPPRATLVRYEARRQMQEYRSQSNALARGPRIVRCTGCQL